MLGKIEGWRTGATEDYRLNGHEFEPTLEDSEGQGSLKCCSPRGCKELDTTEPLNNHWVDSPGNQLPPLGGPKVIINITKDNFVSLNMENSKGF